MKVIIDRKQLQVCWQSNSTNAKRVKLNDNKVKIACRQFIGLTYRQYGDQSKATASKLQNHVGEKCSWSLDFLFIICFNNSWQKTSVADFSKPRYFSELIWRDVCSNNFSFIFPIKFSLYKLLNQWCISTYILCLCIYPLSESKSNEIMQYCIQNLKPNVQYRI